MSLRLRLVRFFAVALLATVPLVGGCQDREEAEEAQFHPADAAIGVPPPKEVLRLPKKPGSYRFAALGDMGRGDKGQCDVSTQVQAAREEVPVRFGNMIG